jgi:hypothetical protein
MEYDLVTRLASPRHSAAVDDTDKQWLARAVDTWSQSSQSIAAAREDHNSDMVGVLQTCCCCCCCGSMQLPVEAVGTGVAILEGMCCRSKEGVAAAVTFASVRSSLSRKPLS